MRKIPIVTNQIYHVFNRGVNKMDIFFAKEDYERFLQTAIHYKTKKNKFSHEKEKTTNIDNADNADPGSALPALRSMKPEIQILACCLMPNHFHFLAKQLVDGGLTSYIQHLSNSYSHYVNTKYKRIGPLFQGRFKNILVETDEQLMHISRYIHLNPLVSDLISDLGKYKWSSYLSYIADYDDGLCDPKPVLEYFKSRKDYEQFVLDQAEYARELERIKHLTIDFE